MARPSLVNTCFRLPTERVFTAAAPTSSAKHQIASMRSEEHTSELQSRLHLVCRLLLEKKKNAHTDRDCPAHPGSLPDPPTARDHRRVRAAAARPSGGGGNLSAERPRRTAPSPRRRRYS